MYGLSSHSKEEIKKKVDSLFDKTAYRLLGPIPKFKSKLAAFLGLAAGATLSSLFLESLGNRYPTGIEQEVLKGILDGAYNYIDVLKNKTSNDIVQELEGMAREARLTGKRIPEDQISKTIQEGLEKARSGLIKIADSESTKARNLASMMDITKRNSSIGEKDPIVMFIGPNDNKTCKECKRMFFMPDGVTPRLWKISELNAGYYKRGDSVPSVVSCHPFCRHTLTDVPSGYGFDNKGHITFIGLDHSELEKQRNGQ